MYNLRLHGEIVDKTAIAAYEANPEKGTLDVRILMPDDYLKIDVRPEQREFYSSLESNYAFKEHMVRNSVYGFNVTSEEKTILVGGFLPHHKHSAYAWLLVDKSFPEQFKQNPRGWVVGLKKLTSLLPFERVETDVLVDFKEGHNLMRLLGFKKEGLMIKSGPGKEDQCKYALIKETE